MRKQTKTEKLLDKWGIARSAKQMERMAMLLVECRDALPAITITQARLHNVSLSLADRIEDALEPWKIDDDETNP